MAVEFLERYSQGQSLCHRWPARAKIVLTLLVIATGTLLPLEYWPASGCLAGLALVGLSVADIPLGYIGRRLALFLPLVLMTALAAPLSRGFMGAWDTAAVIVLRSTVAFLAALWLVSTTPLETLLAGLCRLGMPRVFVSLLIFTLRYLYVLFDELARMKTAQRARTFQRQSTWRSWLGTTQLVGMLLIRALNRAERIHAAMMSRGWRGRMELLDD
ncbi:MAG: cobalt ECF transporter T component CbiQ [Planctomycetes bacterium]|nr:cobalt ECF transporter T component CbiQ [Planctomycetota bacterium]